MPPFNEFDKLIDCLAKYSNKNQVAYNTNSCRQQAAYILDTQVMSKSGLK